MRDVLAALEEVAPSRYALPFDKIGFQVGDLDQQVNEAVVALDRSLGAVEFAAQAKAELLLTHHPLIFNPLNSVDSRSHVGRTILKLVEQGTSFIAAHTNWDAARGGISDALADLFQLSSIISFGMSAEQSNSESRGLEIQPLGRIGTLPEPMTLAELVAATDTTLVAKSWSWGDPGKRINKVAVMGGAADDAWMDAQRAGADVLITGEVKQHNGLEASECGMALIAAGHYQTEHPGCVALRDRMEKALPNIRWHLFTPEPGKSGRPF